MSSVAKMVIVDDSGRYLLLTRAAHPHFGDDPDLPGGGVEDGENPREGVVREVYEETGIIMDDSIELTLLHDGVEYSRHHTHYSLYMTRLQSRPDIALSWEHAAYEWLEPDAFLKKAIGANDTFMHMVHDVLQKEMISK